MAKRITAIVGAIALTSAWALIGALPAGAAPHTYNGFTCDVPSIPLHNIASPIGITVNVSAPATANANSTVTISFPAQSNTLPGSITQPVPASINHFSNIIMTYSISGATFKNGTATHTGSATINGSGTSQTESVVDAHTMTVTWAGPLNPGPLISAPASVKVLAGAVGSTFTIIGTELDVTANVGIDVAAVCALPNSTLSSTAVLAPPPPGSPKVKPDNATASNGGAVTIDVLANDKSGAHKPDPTTLKITTKPKHGSASVTSADKILYTPKSGYSGIDSFQYHVCSVGGGTCAITAVNVTVTAAPPSTTTTTTTTTTMPVTTTTAPGPQLAHTGSTSVPLSVIGFLASLLGAVAVAVFRPRRDYRLPQ